MHFYRSFPLFLSAALLAQAQTSPVGSAAHDHEKILNLDAYVVSSGPDAKTAFDLAQGTSILSGDQLVRNAQPTLGETLAGLPGVNATYYGPGSSRPIIRGLGGDRVRMLSNGVGTLDASNVSPDHNVAVEPLFATRIEVLRGPSTLLYGTSAIGGVVNVIENRIPDAPGDGAVHGGIEGRYGSANDEKTGVAAVNVGTPDFAIQVNALQQKTKDMDIPGVARIDDEAPVDQPRDTLPNSAIDTKSGSVGATYFWKAGQLGASINQYETLYGVPTDEPIQINMKQTRFDLNGELTQPFSVFRSAKLQFGLGRYRHSEVEGEEIGTTFKNKAWEGRLELAHQPIGDITGTIGLQSAYSDFSAMGEEVVTPPYKTQNHALFALEELKRDNLTYQLGARYEYQTTRLGEVSDELPSVPGFNATSGERKNFNAASVSTGLVYYPVKDYSVGLSATYSARPPTAQELFSNGPHGGTGSYEVGSGDLGLEKSLGVELNLRKRAGFVTGSVGVFYNRINNYIFEQQLADDAIPEENNEEGLTPYQFIAKDARFYGAEAEIVFHLIETDKTQLHLKLLGDYVRADQVTDDQPLPRMPPLRYGVAISYEQSRWSFGAEVRHAEAQTHISSTETETPDYTLLNAHASYLLVTGKTQWLLFVRGDNLANAEARIATSFLKDFAPLPGRNLTAGVRLSF